MKRSLAAIFLVFAASSVRLLAMDGFIDKSGRMAIEARFEAAFSFSEGLAGVLSGKKFGYVDKEGNVKIAPQFEEISDFHDGLAGAKSGDKWGYIDKSGKWIVTPQFKWAADFSEGLAAVCMPRQNAPGDRGEKFVWGYIDTTGKMVVAPQFFEAHSFHEGLAMVRRTADDPLTTWAVEMNGTRIGLAGFIDKTGAMVIAPQFLRAMRFSEGLACVMFLPPKLLPGKAGPLPPNGQSEKRRGGLMVFKGEVPSAYIDKTGKVVIDLARWPSAKPFTRIFAEDASPHFDPGKPQPLSMFEDSLVEPASFHGGLAFHDTSTGFVRVPKMSYIDQKGNVVISADVTWGSAFSEDRALVRKGKVVGRFGYIDRSGKIVIEPKYDLAWSFTEGLACIQIGKGWGFIDPSGKVVIEPSFGSASPFSEGLARVSVRK